MCDCNSLAGVKVSRGTYWYPGSPLGKVWGVALATRRGGASCGGGGLGIRLPQAALHCRHCDLKGHPRLLPLLVPPSGALPDPTAGLPTRGSKSGSALTLAMCGLVPAASSHQYARPACTSPLSPLLINSYPEFICNISTLMPFRTMHQIFDCFYHMVWL